MKVLPATIAVHAEAVSAFLLFTNCTTGTCRTKMDDDQQWPGEGGFLLNLSKSNNSRKPGTSPATHTHIN